MTPSANSGKFTRGRKHLARVLCRSRRFGLEIHPTGLRTGGLAVVDTCRSTWPRAVVIVDAMPLNGNGKIAKPMLRKLITAQVGSESRNC
jgi:hypothetical protein